jgi:hypothetical protein
MGSTFNRMPGFRVYYTDMDKRLLLFPAAATVCWAQQANPAADEAKQALIGRVEEYYKLMIAKQYRQAEAMVATESKDDYYNGKKPDIRGFDIMKIEIQGDTAVVTINAKVRVLMLGAVQLFDMPSPSYWKIDNGRWCWYVPEEVKRRTPFGTMKKNDPQDGSGGLDGEGKAPSLASLQGSITIDRTSLLFAKGSADQNVVIRNGLPGPIDLRLDPHADAIKGLHVSVDKLHLESGQTSMVKLLWDGETSLTDTVEITASPVNRTFEIKVAAK